ncbi:MAG: hypothetical protein ACT4TC_00765, partial [Myxococcaceae bacterium]
PAERILTIAKIIEDAILQEPQDAGKLLDLMMTQDLRRQVFLLEGQMRMYRGQYGEPFEKLRARSEQFEDQLGQVSLYRGLVKLALEKSAPTEVVEHLQLEQKRAEAKAIRLIKQEWMPNPANRDQIPGINRVVDAVTETNWPGYADDRTQLKMELAKHLDGVVKDDFDMNDTEGGIHRLRRALRWVSVYIEATNGLMQLNDQINPLPEIAPLLEHPLATSKYMRLPPADREAARVDLPKSLYVAVAKWVQELGALKDKGEPVELLSEVYLKLGLAADASEAHQQVETLLGQEASDPVIHGEAKKVYDEIQGSGVLETLRDGLLQPEPDVFQ